MSKGSASTIVLISGAVLIVLALLTPNDGSRYKKIWAAGLLTVGLGIAADFVPEIVGPFAGAVIIASVVKNPGVIGKFVNSTGAPAAAGGAVKKGAQTAATIGTSVNPAVNPFVSGPVPAGR